MHATISDVRRYFDDLRFNVVISVTLDGKPRGTITIGPEAPEKEAMRAGLRLEAVRRLMEGRDVARAVFVPGKILSIVTKPSQ